MGIIDRLERADVNWHPLDERWYSSVEEFSNTFAGFPIGPDTALRVSTVFACNSLIAETIASLPCLLYRRLPDGGKERARDHRLYRTLRFRPVHRRKVTPMDFFGGQQMHLGLRGAAIAEIVDDGRRIELLPHHPDQTWVEETTSGSLRYEVHPPGRDPRVLLEDRVLHVRDLPLDTMTGLARATLAREAVAVAAAAEAFVGGFYKNDATGRLLVTHPASLNEEKRKEFRAMIQENYGGWANRAKAMLLTNGVTATELGKHDDSGHLIDPRNYQVADIARFWRVPLFMIGLEEKSTTWGTGVESQKQGFVDFTIKPWTDRWAQAMTLSLLTEEEQETFFIEFLFEDLVRGNLLERMRSYLIAKNIGVLSPNEIRERENMGPREGGDEYQETPMGAAPDRSTESRIPSPLLEDLATRIAVKEVRAVERRARKADGDLARWTEWLETYYGSHKDYARDAIAPIAESFDLDPWAVDAAALAIESSALSQLAEGMPNGWTAHRQDEVRQVIAEAFREES